LGEGFTNADAVIGHFDLDALTRAGLRLRPHAKQFTVVEAKMFSPLSARTKNAPSYNQAVRYVACMAAAISHANLRVQDFDQLGFYIIAPSKDRRSIRSSEFEVILGPDALRAALRERISAYERSNRSEVEELLDWERSHFIPLVERLASNKELGVLSWEDCISSIAGTDPATGQELRRFYDRCLQFAPNIRPR
jgi:hypothetical protein